MTITLSNIMLTTAGLLFVSVLAAKAGSRLGVPTLVLFLAVGMLGGVDGFGIHFDSAKTVELIGMIALSVILFTGGVDTRVGDIRPVLGPGVSLATLVHRGDRYLVPTGRTRLYMGDVLLLISGREETAEAPASVVAKE